MKITVTQVTEIEVSDKYAPELMTQLNAYKKHKLPITKDTVPVYHSMLTSWATTILDTQITIADLEKSGEI